jgi:hypothetical protein
MGSVAVCCGFNHYEHVPSLACAMNDAVHPYAELTTNRAFNSDPGLARIGHVFTQRTTSADEVLAAFARAAGSSAELVWFSFSGHAVVSERGELRLVLPRWRGDGSEEDRCRRSIAAGDLEDVMRPHLAHKKFVIVIDACFSGAFGGPELARDIQPSIDGRSASAGVVVMAACATDQRASDGRHGANDLARRRIGTTGTFTSALIEVLRDRIHAGASLRVLELFLEAKRKLPDGQSPTLHVRGLTDDFAILSDGGDAGAASDIAQMSVAVPRTIEHELASFLKSVVRIARKQRVGLVDAKGQLQQLAAAFDRYGEDSFVVSGTNANVVEAFDVARECIVGCTTQPYFEEWHRCGMALLTANEQFVHKRGGRVVRFFFVEDDFQDRVPGAINMIRHQLEAGIRAVIVHVASFGPAVMQAVFNDPCPSDLSLLECAFVDGKIFLKVMFIGHGVSKIEIDQRTNRCQHEYRALLQPFLTAPHGRLFGARLDPADRYHVEFDLLDEPAVEALRRQLECDLGLESQDLWAMRASGYGGGR